MPLSTEGQWTGATPFNIANPTIHDTAGHSYVDTRGLFILHAALLNSGKVICFGGHVESMNYAMLCYVFDPANAAALMAPITFPSGADPFCAHYVQVPDGRLLAVGGSQHDVGVPGTLGYVYRGSTGETTIALFNPTTETWARSMTGGVPNELRQGRWYPTAVTLADGRVAVFSGRRELDTAGAPPAGVAAPFIADMVEILSPPDWASTELTGGTKDLPIYPGMHLAPNGRIYFTHTNWGQEIPDPDTVSLLIASGATSGTWTSHGVRPASTRREEGMSVLLPLMLPSYTGKILVIGGSRALDSAGRPVLDRTGRAPADPIGPAIFDHIENVADTLAADVLDTSTNTWASVGPMNFGRINGHCVLLPDATVLICGGHDNYKWQNRAGTSIPGAASGTNPSLFAEIYTPGGGFHTVPVAERGDAGRFMGAPRMYHSVAVLLPDGRVWVAGGADPNGTEPVPPYPAGWNDRRIGPGQPLNTKNYEFFEPPYMHNGPRPVLTDVQRNGTSTRRIEYGQEFNVLTPQAASIARVAIMRPGAPTHHTDSEQRYVELSFTAAGSGQIKVTAVSDPKIAPPGYYMLWIIDNNTPPRPCALALFIQLLPGTGQPGGGTSCFVATAAFGSPYHPSVVYLQSLRQELREATRAGLHFIRTVNLIYESFSPWLARKVADDSDTREAVREWVVRPVIAAVGAADRLSRRLHRRGLRHAALMTMFTIEAAVGVVALPALATAVLGRIGLSKLLGRRGAREQEE